MSSTFDPWKTYDVSVEEQKAILERKQMREAMKAEYKKKYTDPFRPTLGYIFDPQIQRNYSARFTFSEYFKPSKYVMISAFTLMIPLVVMGYFVRQAYRRKFFDIETGKVGIEDRLNALYANP